MPDAHLPHPVLVLEKDAIAQQRLAKILLALGYSTDALLFSENNQEASHLLKQQTIAVALLDFGLADGNVHSLIQALRRKQANCRILIISENSDEAAILNAIQAGATGYILKKRDDYEVSLVIHSLIQGDAPIDPFMVQHLLNLLNKYSQKISNPVARHTLSGRELQILALIAQGLSNKEIAELLYLSKYTVECHIKHIYRKLNVSSRAKAINAARNIGLLN